MSPWRCVAPPIPEPWLIWAGGTADVVTASGADAITYLQGQLAQDIEGLGIGQCRYSLLLQPQGKVVALTRVVRTASDGVAIIADAGSGAGVIDRLERFKLRMDCELALSTTTVTRVRASDPSRLPEFGESTGDAGFPAAVPLLWPTLAGADVIAGFDPASVGEGARQSADLVAAADIGAGIPRHGTEIAEDTIPAELGVLDLAVDFTKGCYVGQELVARMDSRGNRAPRRLRSVCAAGPPPHTGASVTTGDEDIGHLTSVAAVGDGWVGLASIKRSAAEVTAGTVLGSPVTIADQLES